MGLTAALGGEADISALDFSSFGRVKPLCLSFPTHEMGVMILSYLMGMVRPSSQGLIQCMEGDTRSHSDVPEKSDFFTKLSDAFSF